MHSSDMFVLVLRREDLAPRSTWVAPQRVVFLHGWLQDHTCWLGLAHSLRERYGFDCCLLDWPAHGRSPTPASPVSLTPSVLVEALRSILERLGWTDAPLALCGCSLGGAMALRYTTRFGGVERLVLVAPAGFEEPAYMLSWWGSVLLPRLVAGGVAPPGVTAKMQIASTTPRYGVEPDWFNTAAARKVRHTLVVCGRFDWLHRAHLWTGCRRDDPTFRLRLLPLSHAMICSMISHLGLEDDVTVWTQADTKDREREPKTLRSSL